VWSLSRGTTLENVAVTAAGCAWTVFENRVEMSTEAITLLSAVVSKMMANALNVSLSPVAKRLA
jgi:hypothetical protein